MYPTLIKEIEEALGGNVSSSYDFIITPSSLRPISLKALKKYLEALLQQVKDLEVTEER